MSEYSLVQGGSFGQNGFLSLQSVIDRALISILSNQTSNSSSILFDRFPWGKREEVYLQNYGRNLLMKPVLGITMTLSLLATFYVLIAELVAEKEEKIRESLKMLGMMDSPYWISWFLIGAITYIPSIIVCVGLNQIYIFKGSTYGVIWLLYFLYCCSLMPLGFFFSAFLNKAR